MLPLSGHLWCAWSSTRAAEAGEGRCFCCCLGGDRMQRTENSDVCAPLPGAPLSTWEFAAHDAGRMHRRLGPVHLPALGQSLTSSSQSAVPLLHATRYLPGTASAFQASDTPLNRRCLEATTTVPAGNHHRAELPRERSMSQKRDAAAANRGRFCVHLPLAAQRPFTEVATRPGQRPAEFMFGAPAAA